jgi:hypothetical protein
MDTKRYPPDKPGNFFECVPCIGGVLRTTVGRLVPGGYDPNPIPTWWFSGGEDFKGDSRFFFPFPQIYTLGFFFKKPNTHPTVHQTPGCYLNGYYWSSFLHIFFLQWLRYFSSCKLLLLLKCYTLKVLP